VTLVTLCANWRARGAEMFHLRGSDDETFRVVDSSRILGRDLPEPAHLGALIEDIADEPIIIQSLIEEASHILGRDLPEPAHLGALIEDIADTSRVLSRDLPEPAHLGALIEDIVDEPNQIQSLIEEASHVLGRDLPEPAHLGALIEDIDDMRTIREVVGSLDSVSPSADCRVIGMSSSRILFQSECDDIIGNTCLIEISHVHPSRSLERSEIVRRINENPFPLIPKIHVKDYSIGNYISMMTKEGEWTLEGTVLKALPGSEFLRGTKAQISTIINHLNMIGISSNIDVNDESGGTSWRHVFAIDQNSQQIFLVSLDTLTLV